MSRKSKNDILDRIDTYHSYHIFPNDRTIDLLSDQPDNTVGYPTAARFIKNLHIVESLSLDPITIHLNTSGGDVIQGMAIYDAILNSKCHITIKVFGECMSIGSVILQAADDRVLLPNSCVMFHSGTGGGVDGNPDESLNGSILYRSLSARCDKILFDKINEKRVKENQALMAKRTFEMMNMKGKFMLAEEAVDIGLADRIEYPDN